MLGKSSYNIPLLRRDLDENDRRIRALLNEERLEKFNKDYAGNPIAFIRDECFILNPDRDPPVIPFKLYDYQEQFVESLWDGYRTQQDILDEKSRQMGLSWLYMAFFLWGLMYDKAFTGFVMSYKQDLVDDGGSESSPNSLLGKLRFIYDYLRAELRESHPLYFKYLRVTNQKSGAYLVGESSNVNAGRGGTYKIGLWDETASTPKSELIFQAFHQAVRCRCFNSTVRGKGNVFARLRWDTNSGVEVHTFHWTLHPEKGAEKEERADGRWTSPWYEYECKELTPTQIAQELDIDYEASVEGRIYFAFNRQTHIRKLQYDADWFDSTIIAWDLGVADEMFGIVFQQDNQGGIGAVDEIVGTDQEVRFYIQLMLGIDPPELEFMHAEQKKYFASFAKRARERKYWRCINVAGPDAAKRSITSRRSVRDQFMNAVEFGKDPASGRTTDRRYRNMRMIALTGFTIMDRILEVRKVIDPPRNRVIVSENCVNLIERLFNYKWAMTTDGYSRDTPEHDWASHGSDAFGYGVLYFTRRKAILSKPSMGGTRKARPAVHAPMRVGR